MLLLALFPPAVEQTNISFDGPGAFRHGGDEVERDQGVGQTGAICPMEKISGQAGGGGGTTVRKITSREDVIIT